MAGRENDPLLKPCRIETGVQTTPLQQGGFIPKMKRLSRSAASIRILGGLEKGQEKTRKKSKKQKIRRISYTATNHVQVLFQMYGSALPQVLPFCIANIVWTLLVYYLQKMNAMYDLTFKSATGHSFMGLLVSFLVVARSRISYDRFMEIRRHLAVAYRSCRELTQFTCVYTFQTQTDAAKRWRQEVAFRTILLLRVTMDALHWSSTHRECWEDDYHPIATTTTPPHAFSSSTDFTTPSTTTTTPPTPPPTPPGDDHLHRFSSFHHGQRTMIDENFRATIAFSHILRETIMLHPKSLDYTMPVNEYRDLLHFVTTFMDAFHGFRVLIFTPYPFSLVQMTRMFLFFWVYTLPLVMVADLESIGGTVCVIFMITFGFVGTEYVSMALDDPFGDEDNDIDEHGMALLVYEDIYLATYRADGHTWAADLRDRVLARYRQGRGLDCYHEDLSGSEFWERARNSDDIV